MNATWGRRETRRRVAVKGAALRESSGSAPGDVRSHRWWRIELHCGHVVERDVTYRPLPAVQRGRPRTRRDVLPAPRACRCDECPRPETP